MAGRPVPPTGRNENDARPTGASSRQRGNRLANPALVSGSTRVTRHAAARLAPSSLRGTDEADECPSRYSLQDEGQRGGIRGVNLVISAAHRSDFLTRLGFRLDRTEEQHILTTRF